MKNREVNMPPILKAADKFLRQHGYIPIVVGGISVEGKPPLKYNFRLVIDFTGRKIEEIAEKSKKA
jgi:hypothetical protein